MKNNFVIDSPGENCKFQEHGTESFYDNVLVKATHQNEEVLFVPKNLVFEKIGKFMSESKLLKKSIESSC